MQGILQIPSPGTSPSLRGSPVPAAPVALDPGARLLHLGDPLPTEALVAREALGAGKGYWELELGRERSWALGVLRDPPEPRNSRDSPDPRHPPWLWALCASQGRLFSASRALGNHPRDPSVLPNHPRDPSVLGNHPRDPSVLPNHPRDPSGLGNHPRDPSGLGNHPRDPSVLGDHSRDPLGLGNHPRDPSVLGDHSQDLSGLPNHPRDPSVLLEHPRDLSVLGDHPGDLSVLGDHPGDLSVLGDHPGDLSVLGVLLDREKALLEFYDAERRQLLAGISLRDPPAHRDPLDTIGPGDPAGTFFPFVSRGEEGALRIRPVPLPVPLPGPL